MKADKCKSRNPEVGAQRARGLLVTRARRWLPPPPLRRSWRAFLRLGASLFTPSIGPSARLLRPGRLVEAEGQVWAPPPACAAVQRLVPRSRCPAFRTPRHVLVSQQSREVIKVGGSGLAMRVYQVLLSCKLRSSPPTLLLPLSAHPAIEGCPGRSQPGDAPALGSSGTWRRGGAEERAAFSALLARVWQSRGGDSRTALPAPRWARRATLPSTLPRSSS